jgi:hypothetical protein
VTEDTSVIRQRGDLKYLVGTEVECSGRVKEFRPHVKRKDLDSLCLVNVFVTPLPLGESIYLDHLWVLKKQFKVVGSVPQKNERIHFIGKVYSYKRVGGKSIDRGLFGLEDFGILPLTLSEDYEN